MGKKYEIDNVSIRMSALSMANDQLPGMGDATLALAARIETYLKSGMVTMSDKAVYEEKAAMGGGKLFPSFEASAAIQEAVADFNRGGFFDITSDGEQDDDYDDVSMIICTPKGTLGVDLSGVEGFKLDQHRIGMIRKAIEDAIKHDPGVQMDRDNRAASQAQKDQLDAAGRNRTVKDAERDTYNENMLGKVGAARLAVSELVSWAFGNKDWYKGEQGFEEVDRAINRVASIMTSPTK